MYKRTFNLSTCPDDESAPISTQCNTVLEIEPNNVKALYRRGLALLSAGESENALVDFQRVLQLDPRNSAAAQQIAHCQKLHREAYEKDKKLYKNMFSKFASKDNEVQADDTSKELNK